MNYEQYVNIKQRKNKPKEHAKYDSQLEDY